MAILRLFGIFHCTELFTTENRTLILHYSINDIKILLTIVLLGVEKEGKKKLNM